MDGASRLENLDLNALLTQEDRGKWVAFAPDYSAVWTRAESPKALYDALSDEERARKPVFYRVPEIDAYYIPRMA